MKNRNLYKIIMSLFIGAGLSSCDDTFDTHYSSDIEVTGKLNMTCLEYLEKNGEYSDFVEMIKSAGMDDELKSARAYTVWAPVNSSLADVKANISNAQFMQDNPDYITKFVQNHIALFSYTTSGLNRKSIKMINGKVHIFTYSNGVYEFGEKVLGKINENISQALNNGIVYKIDQDFIPYKINLWEYINETSDLSSLKEYIYAYSDSIFDENLSAQIGFDANGEPLYDTIFKHSNIILNKIGYLHLEDSIYNVLFLNNEAWDQIYPEIRAACTPYNTKSNIADSIGNYYAGYKLLENSVFRTIPENILSLVDVKDSIMSTTKNYIHRPARLFENVVSQENVSNGTAYMINKFPLESKESWRKEITVNAALTEYGRSNTNSTIESYKYQYEYENMSGGKEVKDVQYIYVSAEAGKYGPLPASTPSVKIPIPNVMASTYRVKCKFYPSSAIGSSLPNKLSFELTYNINGRVVVQKRIASTSPLTIPYDQEEPVVIFENVAFPHANLIDISKDITTSDIEVSLNILSQVQRREDGVSFLRNFMVESVILEPIEQ